MNKNGLNQKEQRLLKVLSDRKPHGIRELKKLFTVEAKKRCAITYEKGWGDAEVDTQAQSFVRNALRALIETGWCDGPHTDKSLARGTYRLTKNGLDRLRRVSKKSNGVTKSKTKAAAKAEVKADAKPKTPPVVKPEGKSEIKAKAPAKPKAKSKAAPVETSPSPAA